MENEDEKPWHARVDPASPDRCQAIGAGGDQCHFGVIEVAGKKLRFCRMHGSGASVIAKREAKRLYNLTKYRQQVDDLQQPEPNLDEEVGILRVTLQELMNRFEGVELVTQSSRITSVVKSIQDAIQANLKMKSALGQLMDRAAINRLCDAIVGIAQRHVSPDKMDAFAADVAGAIAEAVASRMEDR